MATDTELQQLKINLLTSEQFKSAAKQQDELYLVKDDEKVINVNYDKTNGVYILVSSQDTVQRFADDVKAGRYDWKIIVNNANVYYSPYYLANQKLVLTPVSPTADPFGLPEDYMTIPLFCMNYQTTQDDIFLFHIVNWTIDETTYELKPSPWNIYISQNYPIEYIDY